MSVCGQAAVMLAALVSSASGFLVIGTGDCPATGTKANFDINQYLGKWYEYERFDNPFEIGVKCGTAQYDLIDQQTVRVVNGGIREFKLFNVVLRRAPTEVNGTAVVVDPSKPAELKVSFSEFDMSGSGPNYFVVDTDYSNYAVVFSCSKINLLNLNVQFAWVLTRQQGVPPANLQAIRDNLQAAGVDVGKLKVQVQTGCDVQ